MQQCAHSMDISGYRDLADLCSMFCIADVLAELLPSFLDQRSRQRECASLNPAFSLMSDSGEVLGSLVSANKRYILRISRPQQRDLAECRITQAREVEQSEQKPCLVGSRLRKCRLV